MHDKGDGGPRSVLRRTEVCPETSLQWRVPSPGTDDRGFREVRGGRKVSSTPTENKEGQRRT